MKNIKAIFLALVFTTVVTPVLAADMGVSRGWDLDALWAAAQKDFDTGFEDAVLLLEAREITLAPDGTRATRVHRVVWITSAVGIRAYADLRVPWDSATSELEVEVLRTWRDGRWWPDPERISETAVVHTLPHALRTAHDYTTMLETMLLHDGVELPCIMETVYTITGKLAFAHADGLFVLPQRDPAAKVALTVRAPAGMEVKHAVLNGAPEPAVDNTDGQLVMTWTMEDVAPLKTPLTGAPERYEPAVAWSTWPSWEDLSQAWFEACRIVDDVDEEFVKLRDDFWAGQPAALDRMKACRDWIDEHVRPVRYDSGSWFGRARDPARTLATGYGHALDRALLFDALLGGQAGLVFAGPVGEPVAPDVPRLSALGDLLVGATSPEPVFFDPAHGTLLEAGDLAGRPRYLGGAVPRPAGSAPEESACTVEFVLDRNEDGEWSGSAVYRGGGLFFPGGGYVKGGPAGRDAVEAGLKRVVPGAELVFEGTQGLVGGPSYVFAVEMDPIDPDPEGISRLVLGNPAPGIADLLPEDVHLEDETRGSPVILPAKLTRTVRVKFRGGTFTTPEPGEWGDDSARFTVKVLADHGWTVVERGVRLEKARYEPGEWPALRALLLEERDPRHGTILLD